MRANRGNADQNDNLNLISFALESSFPVKFSAPTVLHPVFWFHV